ncbi:hypothetical protein EON62_05145 [archaeon]|nr:MAG: hypothetical protein EON62_05145 [archaeon]
MDSELMKDTLMSGELDALELFWRRYNKALLDKLAAQRYKESLEKENRELREALEQCLAGTTLGADTMAKGAPNPLFIVNGRSGVQQQAPPILGARDARVSALPHVTTIDATATMRVYASHARA